MKTWITDAPIEAAAVLAAIGASTDGAAAMFLGTVRDHNDGRRVTGLEYDVYRPMAERVLREIADAAGARWQTDRIAAVHRVGRLDIGETSVAIAVSTPHRADAFDACRYIIEEIKTRLPVWKRELYADGETMWLDGRSQIVAGAAHE